MSLPAHPLAIRESPGSILAIMPLLVAMPLMFWPRVIESDTQPWVVIGSLIAFCSYWPDRPFNRVYGLGMTLVVPAAALAYVLRGPDLDYAIRYTSILATFYMLWMVAAREPGEIIAKVIRVTIVMWFIAGLYQTVATRLGLPLQTFGRFDPSRSGVPSLTAEASYFGSLSIVQLMYLLTENRRSDRPLMAMAIANVLMSGSVLSFLLLAIPAARIPTPYKVVGGILVIAGLFIGIDLAATGFFTRIQNLSIVSLPDILVADPSTNLRFGHIYFTLWENLWQELSLHSSADFYLSYNGWAATTPVYIFTLTDFILPSGGELLFRSGPFGLAVVIIGIHLAYIRGDTRYEKIEKATFVAACFLNPISIANPFFIFYIHKRYVRRLIQTSSPVIGGSSAPAFPYAQTAAAKLVQGQEL